MPPAPSPAWTEQRLINECLQGNEEAWSVLVDRYKNLVYSIPLKYGITGDDASDVFQAVFFELIAHMPELRNPKALPMWLIQTASHKCQHFHKLKARFSPLDEAAEPATSQSIADGALRDWDQQRILQKVLHELPPRCRRLVEMLFFETPPRPYENIARDLGIATGSIGFIRGRCLAKMRAALVKAGFPCR